MRKLLLFLSLGVAIALHGQQVTGNGASSSSSSATFPIGTILPTAPSDGGTWLPMNGQIVAQSTYATLFKIVGHQPQFTWTVSKITSGGAFTGVAFGNSTYVAVGASGAISTSTDLITWTAQTSGVATLLNSVIWDSTNSLFITVGASNVILTSPDGVTWTSRTSGVTSTLNNVFFVGGRSVAVGTAGWITYSTNGTSWTATQANATPSFAYIVFTNGIWFTAANVAGAGGIAYSSDGITWNYTAKPTTNNCFFLGFDATYFYLVDSTTSEIWRSTTGATWTSVTSSAGLISSSVSAFMPVVFSGGVIAVSSILGGYTSDGFSTFSRFRLNGGVLYGPASATAALSPLGNSSQHFGLIISVSGVGIGTQISVDGKTWFCDSSSFLTVPFTNGVVPYKNFYVNSRYFVIAATVQQLASAPEPYNPTSNFQIPTRLDASGTALYIKAL